MNNYVISKMPLAIFSCVLTKHRNIIDATLNDQIGQSRIENVIQCVWEHIICVWQCLMFHISHPICYLGMCKPCLLLADQYWDRCFIFKSHHGYPFEDWASEDHLRVSYLQMSWSFIFTVLTWSKLLLLLLLPLPLPLPLPLLLLVLLLLLLLDRVHS